MRDVIYEWPLIFNATSYLGNGKAHGVPMNFAVMNNQSKDDLLQCTNTICYVGCIDEGGIFYRFDSNKLDRIFKNLYYPKFEYSEDLKSGLILNGWKEVSLQMVQILNGI